MQVPPEAKKKALEAFKQEIENAVRVLRAALRAPSSAWNAKDNKGLLHRLKGGAGFLGLEHLRGMVIELEKESTSFPNDPAHWEQVLSTIEKDAANL